MKSFLKLAIALTFPLLLAGCPSPTPSPTTPADQNAVDEVISLTNKERAAHGLKALKKDPNLTKEAQRYAELMQSKGIMDHGLDGSLGTRFTKAGYLWSNAGENIAKGYKTPASVMNGWMNSPGHRAAILTAKFEDIGVGVAGVYWCQLFGRKGFGLADNEHLIVVRQASFAKVKHMLDNGSYAVAIDGMRGYNNKEGITTLDKIAMAGKYRIIFLASPTGYTWKPAVGAKKLPNEDAKEMLSSPEDEHRMIVGKEGVVGYYEVESKSGNFEFSLGRGSDVSAKFILRIYDFTFERVK